MATATTPNSRLIILALVLSLTACCGVSAPSPAAPPPEIATAPSPATNPCFNALLNMSDCLSYVEEGSKTAKPDKPCCPELAGLVDSNPICLCQLLGNHDSLGLKIDLNKALKLPTVCGITTPPVSTCSAIGVPVSLPPGSSASPSSAPKGSANQPSSGSVAPSPGDAGSSSNGATASPSGNKNGASSIQTSALTVILGLVIICVSIFF